MVERERDERLLKNRHQRFGQLLGQRAKSGSESGAQDECLFDLKHGVKNSGWRKKLFGAVVSRSGEISDFSSSRFFSLR